jgi:predicted permease
VLLVGAALLARSFVALLHADRGYDPTNVLTARLPLPAGLSMEQRSQMLDAIAGRLQTTPGIVEAAFGNALPLLSSGGFRAFKMRPPFNPAVEVDVNAMQRVVSPAYFRALALRLRTGRTFTDADTTTSPEVIVVNRSFAARYLGAQPLGAVVPNLGMCRGDNDRWTVVGVVDDMRQDGASDAPQPEIFLPFRQIGCPAAVSDPIVVVRTSDDPAAHVPVLRAIVRDEAPAVALDSVMTLEDRVMTTLAKPRLYAVVLAGFGVFAITIAAVGLFGVLSYSVAQRSREIGVRTALGATPGRIVRLVLRQVAVIAITGIALGMLLAVFGAKSLATFLYGVGEHDAISFGAVAVLLAIVSTAAAIVPARRAARVDPLTVLRSA